MKKPPWLTVTAPPAEELQKIYRLLNKGNLNTVCDWANCPNLGECYRRGTATFMILGSICTRNCAFCAVPDGKPQEVNYEEPKNIAKAVKKLQLRHVVITSVTRDDLFDGGASHFARTIKEIRHLCDDTTIEVLIPDLKGSKKAIKTIVEVKPDIIGHNLETVAALYKKIRPEADYERSLKVIKTVKKMNHKIFTKSALMLGVGEKESEVIEALIHLKRSGCDLLTLGQYLQPSEKHCDVIEYIKPEKFEYYKNIAYKIGFLAVISAPLARSSYHSDKMLKLLKSRGI